MLIRRKKTSLNNDDKYNFVLFLIFTSSFLSCWHLRRELKRESTSKHVGLEMWKAVAERSKKKTQPFGFNILNSRQSDINHFHFPTQFSVHSENLFPQKLYLLHLPSSTIQLVNPTVPIFSFFYLFFFLNLRTQEFW